MNDDQFQKEFFKELRTQISIDKYSFKFNYGLAKHTSTDEYEKLVLSMFIKSVLNRI